MMTDHEHGMRLSPLDVAFLALEHTSPMHLGAVLILTPTADRAAPTAEGTARLLAERAARVPRLRQRIMPRWSPPGGATWAEGPGFDVPTHIHTHDLPDGGWDAVSALIAELMCRPLNLDRPPWALHVLGGLDSGGVDGGRAVVLVTLHHALCDGPVPSALASPCSTLRPQYVLCPPSITAAVRRRRGGRLGRDHHAVGSGRGGP